MKPENFNVENETTRRLKLEKQWLEENKEAIDAYNERIQRNGIFGSRYRRF